MSFSTILLQKHCERSLLFELTHLSLAISISPGSGGGLVVSVLAFYSDDPSSNPGYTKIVFYAKKDKNK